MSFQQVYGGSQRTPGMDPVIETFENEFKWGKWEMQLITGLTIAAATVDTGNTGYTTILRAGLLLGRVTATNALTTWDPSATDGSQNIFGVLHRSVNMATNGTAEDRLAGPVVAAGGLLSEALIVPGVTARGLSGTTNEWAARKQLRANFFLNDDYNRARLSGFTLRDVSAAEQTGGYTILESDCGSSFENTGGTVTLTLPTVAKRDLEYKFTAFTATTDAITVSSGSSNILVPGASAASSLAVDGDCVKLRGNGTSWVVEQL